MVAAVIIDHIPAKRDGVTESNEAVNNTPSRVVDTAEIASPAMSTS